MHVLSRTTRGLQGDPHLTEALTRAFMFADASVQSEIHHVGMLLTSMLTRAMHPDKPDLTDEDVAIARVIGDVWLSALVGWVTGRTSHRRRHPADGRRRPAAPELTRPKVSGGSARLPVSFGRSHPPKAWVAVTPPSTAISAPVT